MKRPLPMNKPWLSEPGGYQLDGYLGSRGTRTGQFRDTEELLQTAAGVFEIPMKNTCQEMVDVISALPKAERKRLAEKNIGPSPHRRKHKGRGSLLNKLAAETGVTKRDLKLALRRLANSE